MKPFLRKHHLEIRRALPESRRQEASLRLKKALQPLLANYASILSFMPLPDEINLLEINFDLAKAGKLLLPKVEGVHLRVYKVTDIEKQTIPSPKVLEPIPDQCEEVDPATISCILVPGLAFDLQKHRLGFGKGHYDRLLPKTSAYTIGVGFKEQLTPALPSEPHDIPLDSLLIW